MLIGKLGLDGHDRGAKVMARILRNAEMEVIYSGTRHAPVQIECVAIQEGVDVITSPVSTTLGKSFRTYIFTPGIRMLRRYLGFQTIWYSVPFTAP